MNSRNWAAIFSEYVGAKRGLGIFMQLQHAGAFAEALRYCSETVAPSAVAPRSSKPLATREPGSDSVTGHPWFIPAVSAGNSWNCLKAAFITLSVEIVFIVRGITRQGAALFQKSFASWGG